MFITIIKPVGLCCSGIGTGMGSVNFRLFVLSIWHAIENIEIDFGVGSEFSIIGAIGMIFYRIYHFID